jgi:hypothetical protein
MGGLWEKHAAMRRVAMQKHQGLGRKMMRMNDRGGGRSRSVDCQASDVEDVEVSRRKSQMWGEGPSYNGRCSH